MKTIRIFISAPDDVAEERRKATEVIASLQPRYAGQFRLVAVVWEDLPLQVDASLAQATDLVLSAESGIDIAVFILWSQLGSAPGAFLGNADAGRRSGTARDFDLMLGAREASAGTRPAILAYRREDPDGFLDRQKAHPPEALEDLLHQRQLTEIFIAETFGDARAQHVFAQPLEFAHRLRVHLREILDGLLSEGGAATWDVSEMGAPFRGLEAFEAQHAGIFFGREEEICAVQLALRRQAEAGSAFVLIVGASGSGKSSLARAGVLPAVTEFDLDDTIRSWRSAIFIPGAAAKDLSAGLARTLCAALPELRESDISPESFAADLRENPALQCRLVLPKALGSGVRLFLLLDQFEEIFSHTAIGPKERVAFIAAIDALARSGSVWVLATVRADFYQQCQTLPRLMEMKGVHGQFDLLPPDADDLRRIITAPASLAGLRFEKDETSGEALDRRLLADATQHPEALPLLEYALRELFERRAPDGTLTLAQYRELGGVEGALGHRAETVFLALPVAVQAALDGVMSALVTVREDATAGATRARVTTESAASTPERARLITAFVQERLFFTDRDAATGESILTLSHEALLRCWPRAAEWIERNGDFLRVRARLRESVRAWTENARGADYFLPPGKPLEDARTLLAARGADLAPAEREYIAESIAHAGSRERTAKRRRRLAFSAMIFLTLTAVAGGALALVKTQAAKEAARNADVQRALAVERANTLKKSEASARASQRSAEAEGERAKKATAEKETERKKAEENRRQAEATLNDLRGVVDQADAGPLAVKLAVQKRVDDYYERVGEDKNDPRQLERREEDARNKGDTAMALGDVPEAALNYEASLKITRGLVQRDSKNDDWQFRLSASISKMGDVQIARGDSDEAIASYREALQIRRQLVARDPANKGWRFGLSVSLETMGDLDMEKADFAHAAVNYEESQKILQELDAADPKQWFLQRALGLSFGRIGENRKAQGDLPGAAESHTQAMKILQELLQRQPERYDVQRELTQSFSKLGRIEQDREKPEAAAKNFQQAADMLRKLVRSDSQNTDWQLELSVSLGNLAAAQQTLRDLPAAEENFAETVAILESLDKAGKLSAKQALWPAIFRENLNAVRKARRTEKK